MRDDIFKGEDLLKEENNISIFKQYIEKELKKPSDIDLHPDFIIKNIKIEKFMEIINSKNYIFRKSTKFQFPKEFQYIIVFGEIKINPDLIKTKKGKKKNILVFVII